MPSHEGAKKRQLKPSAAVYVCRLFLRTDDIFDILQNRSKHIFRRIDDMLKYCETEATTKTAAQWAKIYLSLEQLDKNWGVLLCELQKAEENQLSMPKTDETELAFEQLAVYFAFRHLADGLDDDRLCERAKFVDLSCKMIYWLCTLQYSKAGALSVDDIVKIARMYSSEIEYNDDNIDALLNALA